MPTLKVIHIAKSLKKPATQVNLSKSMPLPSLQAGRKIMYENTTKNCGKNQVIFKFFW